MIFFLAYLACVIVNVFIVRYMNQKYVSASVRDCVLIVLCGPFTLFLLGFSEGIKLLTPALKNILAVSDDAEDLDTDEDDSL